MASPESYTRPARIQCPERASRMEAATYTENKSDFFLARFLIFSSISPRAYSNSSKFWNKLQRECELHMNMQQMLMKHNK